MAEQPNFGVDTTSTDGLDEFGADEDLTSEVEAEDGETVSISLTRAQIDTLQEILDLANGGDDLGDDFGNEDLATDVDATDDLVNNEDDFEDDFGGEDDFGSEDEDFGSEDEEEDEFGWEEDEENLADSSAASGVWDGSGRQGAPNMTRNTPSYDRVKGKPVQSKEYKNTMSGNSVHDGAGRNGAPQMSRTTPGYEEAKGKKPVKGKATSAAGTNRSIFDM